MRDRRKKAQRGSAATEVPFRIASEQLREGSTTDEHGLTRISGARCSRGRSPRTMLESTTAEGCRGFTGPTGASHRGGPTEHTENTEGLETFEFLRRFRTAA